MTWSGTYHQPRQVGTPEGMDPSMVLSALRSADGWTPIVFAGPAADFIVVSGPGAAAVGLEVVTAAVK